MLFGRTGGKVVRSNAVKKLSVSLRENTALLGFCLGKKCRLIASLCDLLIVKVIQMCATTKRESKYNNFLAITLVHDRRSACVIHLARVDR